MLTLPIKKKWFDMILSGEKTEEYRELKPYYASRFCNLFGFSKVINAFKNETEPRKIIFRNGYSNNSPSFIAECSLLVGEGRPEWGAEPNKEYYILKILDIALPVLWKYDEKLGIAYFCPHCGKFVCDDSDEKCEWCKKAIDWRNCDEYREYWRS